MSFKSEAANVRSGIASGGYKKKSDRFAGFFDELTDGMKRQDAAKAQEDLEAKRETRAENRRIKAAQDAAEKVAKEQKELAKFWLTSNPTIENNPQTQSAVLGAIKQGNFTEFSGLNDFMKTQSKFVPGVTGEPVVDQAAYDELLEGGVVDQTDNMLTTTRPLLRDAAQRGDQGGKVIDVTPKKANPEDTTGRIEFGEQPVAFELAGLTETNWSGTLADEKAKQVPNVKAIAAIEAWAMNEGYVNIIPGYTLKELNTKSLEELLEIQGGIPTTNASAVSSMDAVVEVKKVTEDNKQIFMKPEELITKPASFLTMALGTLTPDSPKYNNVVNALALRTSMDSSVSLAEASANLAGDEDYYRKAIAAYGVLDKNDVAYTANLESLRKLNILLAFEVDKTNAEGLDTDKSRTVKQTALEAFYIANGFFVKAAKGQTVKVPSVADMAKFETSWKKLTDISKEPESWFSDANLMKMSVEDLQVLRDTDILKGKTVALTNVTAILDKRIEVQAATKLSEKLDPSNRSFKDTNELDQFVSGLGIDRIDDDALADFARVRGVLAKQQGILEADEDINAYQVALKAHLMLPANKGKTGQELINVMTNWETTWKDTTAKTEDFVSTDYYLNGDKVSVTSLAQQQQLEKEGWGPVKLGDASQLMADLSIDRATAAQILNKTITVQRNARGEIVLVDKASGTSQVVTQPDVIPSDEPLSMEEAIAQAVGLDPDANPNWAQQNTSFEVPSYVNADGVTIEAQTLTITPAMIQKFNAAGPVPDDIGSIRTAFGLSGKAALIAGKIGGVIGKDWAPKTNDAITYLENLRLNTLITLAGTASNGLRDSVWNKQQILTTLAEPGQVWKGAPSQLRKLKLTLKEIQNGIKVATAERDSSTSNAQRQSKAKVTLAGLQTLKTKYDNVLSLFDKDLSNQDITGSVFKNPPTENETDNQRKKRVYDAGFEAFFKKAQAANAGTNLNREEVLTFFNQKYGPEGVVK